MSAGGGGMGSLPARTRPREELLESAIRKIYPYATGWRNPLPVSVGGKRRTIVHGGKKDHLYAVYQCFYRNQYELPLPLFSEAAHAQALEAKYNRIVAAGRRPLILDCGANIGASVAWFALRYPGAQLVAVEPAPDNLALLRQNVAGLDATVVAGAVGPQDGMLRLAGRDSSPLSFKTVEDGTGPDVEVFSLPSIMAKVPDAEPFILKVDIEGAERSLFASHHAVLSRFPLIVVEPHDADMPGQQVSTALFSFHAAHHRDFLFANENVFSIDYAALLSP